MVLNTSWHVFDTKKKPGGNPVCISRNSRIWHFHLNNTLLRQTSFYSMLVSFRFHFLRCSEILVSPSICTKIRTWRFHRTEEVSNLTHLFFCLFVCLTPPISRWPVWDEIPTTILQSWFAPITRRKVKNRNRKKMSKSTPSFEKKFPSFKSLVESSSRVKTSSIATWRPSTTIPPLKLKRCLFVFSQFSICDVHKQCWYFVNDVYCLISECVVHVSPAIRVYLQPASVYCVFW